LLSEKFRTVLIESQCAVREKFAEINALFKSKEQKLLEQLNNIIVTLETQNKKQLSEIIGQCSS